jgi:HemX protein
MAIVEQGLLFAGSIAYLSALGLTAARLARRKGPRHGVNLGIILLGWILQSSGLWMLGMQAGSCPIRNFFEILQFVSWSIIVVYLFTGQVFRLSLFGTGSATLAALIGLVALFVPDKSITSDASFLGSDPRIEAHAALALFSYGIFGLVAVLAALYLLQNFSLKRKKHAGVFRFLPSITEMDTVILRLLAMACVVYTVSIAIGALYWVSNMEQIGLSKLLPTLALWIAYWLVLILRLLNQLTGSSLAKTCLALMAAALITLWPVEHSRHDAPYGPQHGSETSTPTSPDHAR